ncbi:hypothetical protein EV401DRAFT_1891818 [Pisolithus croceorrhizus]|nr:hypothetical protein EV401DRAFT_1891818 [Pisolithus croceorrhizus]
MKLKASKGKYAGPYTVRDFYDAYLPRHFQFPDVAMMDTENLRMMAEAESTGGPFLLAVEACVPGRTSENASRKGNKIGIRTSGYSVEHESDVDPFPLELCVISRPSTAHDPFEDSRPNVTTTSNSKVSISPSPPFERDHSGRGCQTRSDITSAAVAELEVHSRAFMFSVLILKDEARFIRWDRAGGVVTNRFNYIDNSHLFLEFFWRFAQLLSMEGGRDPSIRSLELRISSGGLGRATRMSPEEEPSCVLDLHALQRRVNARKLYGNRVRGRFECPPPVELRGRGWGWEGSFGEYENPADSKGLRKQRDNRDGEAGYKILLGPAGRTLTSFESGKEMGLVMHIRTLGFCTAISVLATSSSQNKVVGS